MEDGRPTKLLQHLWQPTGGQTRLPHISGAYSGEANLIRSERVPPSRQRRAAPHLEVAFAFVSSEGAGYAAAG